MAKRIILLLSSVIIVSALALGSGISFSTVKEQLRSLKHHFTGYFKPQLRVAALGKHGNKWLPTSIRRTLEAKYKIVFVDTMDEEFDILIVSDNFEGKNYDAKGAVKVHWTSEAYLPDLDHYDLVLAFEHIDSPKYIRLPYYYHEYLGDIRVTERPRKKQGKCNPHKPKFACFLVSNGETDYINEKGKVATGVRIRDSMFHKLSEYKWVASGGKHLNNIGEPIPRDGKKTKAWLNQCKFVISYENQLDEGYITEKVFLAYFAGAIPIYWGDKTAVSDINKDAIIYANDFATENELLDYVKKVDNDDELYCKI